MPKILILFTDSNEKLAELVAEGSRAVRFSEVEIRRVAKAGADANDSSRDYPLLNGVDELVPYDAIVLAASSDPGVDNELRSLLEQAGSAHPRATFLNKVGSAVVLQGDDDQRRAPWGLLALLGDLGMIVVTPAGAGNEAATELGKRAIQVAGWITHARSHHHAH